MEPRGSLLEWARWTAPTTRPVLLTHFSGQIELGPSSYILCHEWRLFGKLRGSCVGPGPAYVTQNGWEINLVNEAGQPSRAWIDWPGHIWAQYWNEGAVYSPDGMTVQFDHGTVWRRVTR